MTCFWAGPKRFIPNCDRRFVISCLVRVLSVRERDQKTRLRAASHLSLNSVLGGIAVSRICFLKDSIFSRYSSSFGERLYAKVAINKNLSQSRHSVKFRA